MASHQIVTYLQIEKRDIAASCQKLFEELTLNKLKKFTNQLRILFGWWLSSKWLS